MVARHFIKTRLSYDEKQRVQALANQQLVTESVWLRRLVLAELSLASDAASEKQLRVAVESERQSREARLYVRLRAEDRLLLRERAAARGLAAATYISFLVRVHLRNLTPLPVAELAALELSIAELNAVGRNLNQIARAANQGVRFTSPNQADLRTMLKVCEALRDHVKALVSASRSSWETGHAQGPL